jgi:hypothetical protein
VRLEATNRNVEVFLFRIEQGTGYVNNSPLNLVDPLGLDDDCGGPCVPFEYLQGSCVVRVQYHKFIGPNGQKWDMPYFIVMCPNGVSPGSSGGGQPTGGSGQTGGGWSGSGSAGAPDAAKIAAAEMDAFKKCALDAAGLAAGGANLIAAGQPLISTRAKFAGATTGTSIVSTYLNGTWRIAGRLPTLTNAGLEFTTSVGTFAARAVPIVGWGMLAWDFAAFAKCAHDADLPGIE